MGISSPKYARVWQVLQILSILTPAANNWLVVEGGYFFITNGNLRVSVNEVSIHGSKCIFSKIFKIDQSQ